MQLKITSENLNDILGKAVELLINGGIIAYPTETFYGIGARFDNEDSLKRIYEIKKRPAEKSMPLIIGSMDLLDVLAASSLNKTESALVNKFWPGPLTLLLRAKKELSRYLTANTGKVAVRIPGESFALHLAKKTEFPITATSANLSGMPPAEDAETVLEYFGDSVDMIIDGGKTHGGQPSTIVDASRGKIRILREGAIPASLLKNLF